MELGEVNIYRMTHIDNIVHILKNGITHRNSPKHNPEYVPIGDVSLISTRDNKIIAVNNGDLLNSDTYTITLGDLIPFYFGIKMPMLYVIQNGGNFVIKPIEATNIIYLACSVSDIIKDHEKFYFTDGHATDNLTSIYDATRIDELTNIIDWNSVKASYWGGQDNLNIKRKKQAEFLVSGDILPKHIKGFGCYDDTAKNTLIEYGVQENMIKIIPKAYY